MSITSRRTSSSTLRKWELGRERLRVRWPVGSDEGCAHAEQDAHQSAVAEAGGKMEGSETIAVEAERWSGVDPREQSCDHLQHDCVLYRRAAL